MIQDVGGLTFVGRLRELRHLGLSVRGHGRIVVQRLDRHTLAVTFFGDYLVDVDRAALARSGVAIFFRGGAPFHGGLARLQVGDSEPVLLPADRVPLPVVRLAGNQRAQGSLVTLDVRATNGRKAHVEASFSRDRVTLAQRLQ